MSDLYGAKQRRIEAEENARRQAELEAEQLEKTKALLTLLFREQELQATIDDTSLSQEERDFAQEELDNELEQKAIIEEEKQAAEEER